MADIIVAAEREGTLEVGRSRLGQTRAAVGRAALSFPLVMGGLALILLPDYLGRYREAEPVPGLYWVALAIMALLFAVIVGSVSALRREWWIFDGPRRQLQVQVRFMASVQEASVPLRDVEGLKLVRGGFGGQARLDIVLKEGRRETLARGYFPGDRLEVVGQAISDYLKSHRFFVELEREA
ncbi:hypothetical protein DV096_04355 [Bradymonadaceae bacterium TMQ3]|uniref:DUF304 domain-containing protein n=1 Tax=Lujinxingia sediminis TaxID=2480984 RepID=A0ABY0CW98_9DELT|nr:hypothetical protein [Lujinxingia sediminis]RDV39802.1 hypothetical protein DV096_04355 [Bradymonadaceae bacterium TMQ3]RVU48153.1 hypothetical protein EA187_01570 [Lujinxingia sediminis]TXC77453.1 hypothetical protein FRC91_01580 [Bradymonadales bacterium TMQ1]